VICGSEGPQTATLALTIDGALREVTAEGDGPVDATFNAITEIIQHNASLRLYQVHAVTEGTDAQAEVSVRLEEKGKSVVGRGADTDTLVASARAYLNALNKLIEKREKTLPGALSA
jgi:2-isopropylmalate synthase